MIYLPPFAVMGTHILDDDQLSTYAQQYDNLINLLQQNLTLNDCKGFEFINEIPKLKIK